MEEGTREEDGRNDVAVRKASREGNGDSPSNADSGERSHMLDRWLKEAQRQGAWNPVGGVRIGDSIAAGAGNATARRPHSGEPT